MSFVIRPSSLPMWPDCERRSIARMAPGLLRDMGFPVTFRPATVGAAIGTGTHAAVAYTLEEKMRSGQLANKVEAEQRGIEKMAAAIHEGVIWDTITPDLNVGQKQLIRMAAIYRLKLAPHVKPVAIERRLEITTKSGNVVSGQVDITEQGPTDLKTGVRARQNIAQYGAYSIILRSHREVSEFVTEHFVPRVRIDKPQPDPEVEHFSVPLAEQVAARVIKRIESAVVIFKETGDPMTFQANPNSQLCADRYCPAWGTKFCVEHRR